MFMILGIIGRQPLGGLFLTLKCLLGHLVVKKNSHYIRSVER